jgi:hypothetical protein
MLKPWWALVLAVAGVMLVPPTGRGAEGDRVAYKFQYYHDNNDVDVFTNEISVGKRLGDKFHLSAGYLVDGITGASRSDMRGRNPGIDGTTGASKKVTVDAVTAASGTAREYRHQVSGTLAFTHDFIKMIRKDQNNDDPTTLSVTGINSQENDYTSRTISAAFTQDLFQRNTTFGLVYGKSFDQFRPAARFVPEYPDEGWSMFGNGRRQTERISASLTQGITMTTVASVIWGYVYDRGYLSRPYYVYELTTDSGSIYRHENLPAKRRSMTITGKLNQYIPVGAGMALHLDYRYYFDSWEIQSHTASGELYCRLGDYFVLRPSYRVYLQNSAFFYEDTYPADPVYLTTDFKYRHGLTHTAGLKLSWEVRDFVRPAQSRFFGLYPVAIDLGGEYYMRTGTYDVAVRNSYYNYWPIYTGYRAFWIQSGMRFAF